MKGPGSGCRCTCTRAEHERNDDMPWDRANNLVFERKRLASGMTIYETCKEGPSFSGVFSYSPERYLLEKGEKLVAFPFLTANCPQREGISPAV